MLNRNFATSLTIGTFVLMAATGVLMFFHLDSGLNKLAHEWIGLLMVAGVGLHVFTNFVSFKRYFKLWQGRAIIGLFALLLTGSFMVSGESGDKPPYFYIVDSLAEKSLAELAQLGGTERLQVVLQAANLAMNSPEQSLTELTGGDVRRNMHILADLFKDY